jgi:pyochelin biosynthetic protein PchC
VCLPPAGSSASFYRTWAAYLPRHIALAGVQYPGRETRLREPAIKDMHKLAEAVASAVSPFCRVPLTFFGHSMGAVLAWEVAIRVENVAALFVSGCAPAATHAGRASRMWDDNSILADLERLGGPNQIVLTNSTVRALWLPALRADYRLTENYIPSRGRMLTCPLVAMCGDLDRDATAEDMQLWSAVTTGPFRLCRFQGNHSFPLIRNREVVLEIVEIVSKLSAGSPR